MRAISSGVLPTRSVASMTVVGAGSVVTRDLPAGSSRDFSRHRHAERRHPSLSATKVARSSRVSLGAVQVRCCREQARAEAHRLLVRCPGVLDVEVDVHLLRALRPATQGGRGRPRRTRRRCVPGPSTCPKAGPSRPRPPARWRARTVSCVSWSPERTRPTPASAPSAGSCRARRSLPGPPPTEEPPGAPARRERRIERACPRTGRAR